MGTQAMKGRVPDKLLAVAVYVLGFLGLIFISSGLAGDAPFREWGSGIGVVIGGIAVLAVVARWRSRRQNGARGETSKDRDNLEPEVSPVKPRASGRFLEAMLFASVVLVIFASYLGLGGVSWKIWASAAAVGIAGLVVGAVIVRREKRSEEGKSGDDDA